MNNEEQFKDNMIKILKLFESYPQMFFNFLNKQGAFTKEFKTKVTSHKVNDKPYFYDIETMIEWYDSLLSSEDKPKDKVKYWNDKLSKAVTEQRYEDAVSIRDYMIKSGYKISQ